jgi:DNA-binding transcriptional regulator PaaX
LVAKDIHDGESLQPVASRRDETTRTRVFGLFMVSGSSSLTLRQLVSLGQAVGLTQTNVKSHISRMTADGSLVRLGAPGASRYGPSQSRREIVDTLVQRLANRRHARWNRRWWVIALAMPLSRARRDRARRALRFAGLRAWNGDVWVRPAWPLADRGRVEALAQRYGALACEGPLVTSLDVERTFSLSLVDRHASRLATQIERTRLRLSRGDLQDSALLRARLDLGGRVAHFISDTPRLPPELLGAHRATGALVASWAAFDRSATAASRAFIDRLLSEPKRSRGRPRRTTT